MRGAILPREKPEECKVKHCCKASCGMKHLQLNKVSLTCLLPGVYGSHFVGRVDEE